MALRGTHCHTLTYRNMVTVLRKWLVALVLISVSLKSSAGVDLFWGISPTQYYINYDDGFIGKVTGENLTLISPDIFFNEEIVVMADSIDRMTARINALYAGHEKLMELLDETYKVSDESHNAYASDMEAVNTRLTSLLSLYLDFVDVIENAYNKKSSPKYKKEAMFDFGLSDIMLNCLLTQASIDFAVAYLEEYQKASEDFKTTFVDESYATINIIEYYRKQVDQLVDNYNYYADYFNANVNNMTADDLITLGKNIQVQIDFIQQITKEEPSNPFSGSDYLLSEIKRLLGNVMDYCNDGQKYLQKLFASVPPLADFSAVLYAGTNENPFGLYYYIRDNESVLTIPATQSYYDALNYTVTGIEGNIFTKYHEVANPNCIKIVIPATVASITNGAFAINGIESVEVLADKIPAMTDDCFTESVYQNATLIVPDGMTDAYASAAGWKNFRTIKSASQSGIESVTADNISINIENGTLHINGTGNCSVSVYSANGSIVYSGYDSTINLPSKGIYIVRAADKVFKIAY